MEGKYPPCKREDYSFIEQIDTRIRDFLKDSDKIEILAKICEEINEQNFIFPYKRLETVRDAVWDYILISLEIKDFYALSLMMKSAKNVGLNLEPLKKKINDAENEVHSKLIELVNILNFKNLGQDPNDLLSETLRTLISYNIRGTLIDVALGVKHHLDEIQMMPTVFNRQISKDIEDFTIMGEYFIDQNLEYADEKGKNWKYCKDLYLHPIKANYSNIVDIQHSELLEILDHCKNCNTEEYFEQNLHTRIFFLLADHRFQFVEHIWNLGKDDFLLNLARIQLQFHHADVRDEMNYDKHNWVKKPVVIKQDVNRKKGCLIPSNKFEDHPLTRSGDVKVKRESFFGFIEKKARKSISGWGNQDEETPLKYYPGPIRKSIRQCKTQEFRKYGPILYEKFCKICEFMDTVPPYNSRLFLITKEYIEILWKSRDLLTSKEVKRTDPLAFLLQEDPDALIDEAYFQFYRFMNRDLPKEKKFFMYKLLCIMTLYVPPSFDLEKYLLRYVYDSIYNNTFKKYYEKIMDNLINYEGSGTLRPYWLPSMQEIYFRFDDPVNFILEYKFIDKFGQVLFIESDTFEEAIKKIMKSDVWGDTEEDKYSFWLFIESDHNEPDIPVNEERNILEFLSTVDMTSSNFILKKRVWQIQYSIAVPKNMEAFIFTELKAKFVKKEIYSEIIDTNSVFRCSAILFMLYVAQKDKDVKSQVNKLQKYLPDIVPQSISQKLSQNAIINKITEQLQNLESNTEDLIQEFIKILDFVHIRTGSMYQGSFQDSSNKRIEVLININTIAIFIFSSNSIKYPLQVISYNQILNMNSCKDYLEIKILNYKKRPESFLLFVDQFCVKPLHEDIIAHSCLKLKENKRLTYCLQFSLDSVCQDNIFNYKLFIDTLESEIKKNNFDLNVDPPYMISELEAQWNLEYPFIGEEFEIKPILRYSLNERKSISTSLNVPKTLEHSSSKKLSPKASTQKFAEGSPKKSNKRGLVVPEISEDPNEFVQTKAFSQNITESINFNKPSEKQKAGPGFIPPPPPPPINLLPTKKKENSNTQKPQMKLPPPPPPNLLPKNPEIKVISREKSAEPKPQINLPPPPPPLSILNPSQMKRPSAMRNEISSNIDQKRASSMRLSHCLNNVLSSLQVINSIKEEGSQKSKTESSQSNKESSKSESQRNFLLPNAPQSQPQQEEKKVFLPPPPPPINLLPPKSPKIAKQIEEEKMEKSEKIESNPKVEKLDSPKEEKKREFTPRQKRASPSPDNQGDSEPKKIQSSVRDRIAKRKMESRKIEGLTKISSERASKSRSREFAKKEDDEEDMSAADKRLAQVRARIQNRNQKFKK